MNTTGTEMSPEERFVRRLRKVFAAGGVILCADLAFAACSGQEDTLELVQVQEMVSEESDAGDEQEDADSNAEDVSESAGTASGNAGEDSDAGEDSAGDTTAGEEIIYVYVCGAVASPGVYALPGGTRVYEAVEEAGGFTEDADETYVNQALILSDQDQLNIPTKEETAALAEDAEDASYGLISGADLTISGGSSSSDISGKININTASQEELETLPGIGETKAAAIIAYREDNGDFASIEDIQNVSGIGEATYNNLKEFITV